MQTYTVEMCDGVSTETVEIEAETLREARQDAEQECGDWCRGGDWGADGASIDIHWKLTDEDGDEVDEGDITVEIEPDHEAKICDACGGKWDARSERCCGTDPDDHDWTSEGEGGCRENPGVWSCGGTAMRFASHCRTCGLHRDEYHTGSQRNPGECDTVEYEMPDTWCAECEREECDCTEAGTYRLVDSQTGYAVVRSDGGRAEFLDSSKARAAMKALASGDEGEDDYEWSGDDDDNE